MVARSSGPFYNLSELVADSAVQGKAAVRKSARETAKINYSLMTEQTVLSFISTGEFEGIEFDNTGTLDHNPDQGASFDAYTFWIGPKPVYFAFYRRANGLWIIKSFHPPEKGTMAATLSYSPFTALEVLQK